MSKLHEMCKGLLAFHCPGCGYSHPVSVDASTHPTGQKWEWNGSMEKPTFRPSLLVNRDYPSQRCHSYVTDGKIEFLSDCFHKFAGQTIEIPDWDD